MSELKGPREFRDCARDEDGSVPCDPVDNGDDTATCSACGWTAGYASREMAQFIRVINGVPTLVTEEVA